MDEDVVMEEVGALREIFMKALAERDQLRKQFTDAIEAAEFFTGDCPENPLDAVQRLCKRIKRLEKQHDSEWRLIDRMKKRLTEGATALYPRITDEIGQSLLLKQIHGLMSGVAAMQPEPEEEYTVCKNGECEHYNDTFPGFAGLGSVGAALQKRWTPGNPTQRRSIIQ